MKITNILLLLFYCISFNANLTAQEMIGVDGMLEYAITSIDLAIILPLPGNYDGTVTIDGSIQGIALNPGKDQTKSIVNRPSSVFQKKPSDIVITGIDSSSFMFNAKSNESLPMYLVMNMKSLQTVMMIVLQNGLHDGRTIRLSKGQISFSIVNRKTGKTTSSIKYNIPEEGIIQWNENKKIIEWYGFTAKLEPVDSN